jgi:hypothetical protein
MTDSTLQRTSIVERLSSRKWFTNTDNQLQQELVSLPEDFAGFLADLANRPEQIGLLEVVRLKSLARGNFLITPVFEVRSTHTKQIFTYEYVSWKHGRLGGYRVIILIEVDNEIRYFMIKKGDKFPTAGMTYDVIGSNQFSPLSPDKFFLQSNVENQIKKLLGVEELPSYRYIDLGLITPDSGMTNNNVGLFAMVLNSSDAKNLEEKVTQRQHTHLPVGYVVEVHPIKQIFEFISKCNDSYFLACFSRLVASHIIKI